MSTLAQPQESQEANPSIAGVTHESTGPVSRPSLYRRLKSAITTRYPVPLLLLVLAVGFMLPGLPPFRVAAPTNQLLIYPPWQAVYPDLTARLPGGDVLLQQLPWRHWAQDELAAGRFPLWASAPLGGTPVFANYQSAIIFPLNLLWVLMPIPIGLTIIMVLKLWIAGLGMWLFLKGMNLHWTASLLGAIGFMFCGQMVIWLPWANTNLVMLMPWLAWVVYVWCIEEKRWALPAFAVIMSLLLLGGHPEHLTIIVPTVAIWAFALILTGPRSRWLRQITGFAAATIAGAAIGAIQLLPFIEAFQLSHIAQDAQRATAWGLHQDASILIDWVLPRWWGQIYDGVVDGPTTFYDTNYLGLPALIGLIFAIIALFRRNLNLRLTLPWLAAGALAWLITYDDALGNLVRRLPILDKSINMRWVLSVGFAVLVLGAFGWDWFARWAESRLEKRRSALQAAESNDLTGERTITLPVVAGIALVAIGAFTLAVHLAGLFRPPDLGNPPVSLASDSYRFYWGIWAVGIVAGIVGAIMLWASGGFGNRTAQITSLIISAFLTADLWMLMITFNQTSTPDKYYPQTNFISQTRSLLQPTDRVIYEGPIQPANTGLVYGIRDWRYQDIMVSQRGFDAARMLSANFEREVYNWYNMFLPGIKLEIAPMLGVRYIVYPKEIQPSYWEPDPTRPNIKRLAFTEGLGLWEIEGVPGFAYLSDNLVVVPDEPAASQWMRNLTWEQVRAYPALVEAPPSDLAGITRAPDASSPGSANVTTYTPGHIVIQTDAQRAALLVVSESYYPGWRATLDGQPVAILRANYLSQGVTVPQGKHTVELKYEPGSFRYGALISLAGLFGLGTLIFWWRRGPRHP